MELSSTEMGKLWEGQVLEEKRQCQDFSFVHANMKSPTKHPSGFIR